MREKTAIKTKGKPWKICKNRKIPYKLGNE